LNAAQPGAFKIENVSESLSASFAIGVNVYSVPVCTDVGGLPEIVGAEFGGGGGGAVDVTVTVNAGRFAVAVPSLTLILMFENVPVTVGVPASSPVVVLNVAHAGGLRIENTSGSLFASPAVGMNE
jgi:hypothetical protein